MDGLLESAKTDGYVPLGRERERESAPESDDGIAPKRMQREHIAESQSTFGWGENVLGFRSFSLGESTKVQGESDLQLIEAIAETHVSRGLGISQRIRDARFP